MRRAAWRVGALSLGVLFGMSCQFTFDNDLAYACATELDCGGGGYGCLSGVCCRPTGVELCGNGLDDDCDGRPDGKGAREECNGRDDDCDGETDEGFELQFNPLNCGGCGVRCDLATQQCNAGACELRPELAEPGCDGQTCGPDGGAETTKAERSCENLEDDDGDGMSDCADQLDCPQSSACTAVLGGFTRGGKCDATGQCLTEFCFDGADNDGDGLVDCGDVADCPAGSPCVRTSNGQPGLCHPSNLTCN